MHGPRLPGHCSGWVAHKLLPSSPGVAYRPEEREDKHGKGRRFGNGGGDQSHLYQHVGIIVIHKIGRGIIEMQHPRGRAGLLDNAPGRAKTQGRIPEGNEGRKVRRILVGKRPIGAALPLRFLVKIEAGSRSNITRIYFERCTLIRDLRRRELVLRSVLQSTWLGLALPRPCVARARRAGG